jgi:radical SAM-linked protein
VQKLRIRYAKRGRLRFSSTRDFSRALERALRRADVPMAFSAGFHPHPLISYANAAPTGTASEAEYFEIRVTERVDPQAVRAALDEALPEGLDVLEVVQAGPGALADRLEASEWHIVVRAADPPRSPRPSTRTWPARSRRRHEPSRPARARSTRAAPCWRWMPPVSTTRGVRYCAWSFGTPHRPFDPMTS